MCLLSEKSASLLMLGRAFSRGNMPSRPTQEGCSVFLLRSLSTPKAERRGSHWRPRLSVTFAQVWAVTV